MIYYIDDLDTYKTFIKNNEKVVVDFYADFCKPCKEISPLIDDLSKKNPSIKFIKIDISNAEDIGDYFNINRIPLLYFYHNSYIIFELEGFNELKLIDNVNKLVLL